MGGRLWQSKEKSFYPKADWDYIGYEAARWWGYTVGEWEREETVYAAKAIAHYMEHNMREGYAAERRKEEADPKKPKQDDFYKDVFKSRARKRDGSS